MDELDALFDAALDPDDSPAPEGAATDDTPDPGGATAVDEDGSPEAVPEEPDDPDPEHVDEGAAGTPPPEPTPPEAPDVVLTDPRYTTLAERDAAQQQVIATFMQRQAEADERARTDAAKAEVARVRAAWAEMDPEDAAKAEARYIFDLSQQQINAQRAEIERMQQDQAAARDLALKPQAIARITTEYGLTAADASYLDRLDNPAAMVDYARHVKHQRQSQTANARQAKAAAVTATKALAGGTAGGAATATAGPDITNMDDLWDELF